jgi:electron transfer flavoprotein alpha subunit
MILVLVETSPDGHAVEVSREAVTFARSLSEAGGGVPVDAVVVGDPGNALVAELASYGVRTVHALTGEAFASYAAAAWASGIQSVRGSSVVVMAAGTPRGNEVMAHLAAREGVAMAANVLSFSGLAPFVVTRQVVGGAALEEMRLAERPAVFTVAGHAVEATPAAAAGPADVVTHEPAIADADLVARVVSSEEPEPDLSGDLKSARVVVGAGRGAGSADGFAELLELTELVGGALGVSRVVTSLGWRPHHEQVGQTGSRISPDLYIPCGISGAIQHWAGCSTAKHILAINSDPDAPMVTKASHAVIGDLHEIVPAINAEIRRRRGSGVGPRRPAPGPPGSEPAAPGVDVP